MDDWTVRDLLAVGRTIKKLERAIQQAGAIRRPRMSGEDLPVPQAHPL